MFTKNFILLFALLIALMPVTQACFYGIPCDECDDCCDGADMGGAGYGICMIGCGRTCK